MKVTVFLQSITLVLLYFHASEAQLTVYFNSIGEYFGYRNPRQDAAVNDEFMHRIPYEVDTMDEKFLNEAASLTGVALSELDNCQQRVNKKEYTCLTFTTLITSISGCFKTPIRLQLDER